MTETDPRRPKPPEVGLVDAIRVLRGEAERKHLDACGFRGGDDGFPAVSAIAVLAQVTSRKHYALARAAYDELQTLERVRGLVRGEVLDQVLSELVEIGHEAPQAEDVLVKLGALVIELRAALGEVNDGE